MLDIYKYGILKSQYQINFEDCPHFHLARSQLPKEWYQSNKSMLLSSCDTAKNQDVLSDGKK